jgi:hypothetical protein
MPEAMGIERIVAEYLELEGYHVSTNVPYLPDDKIDEDEDLSQATGKSSDIDVLAKKGDEIIAVECKAEGKAFDYHNINTEKRPENDILSDKSLGGLVGNIGLIREPAFRGIEDQDIDKYWIVYKGFFNDKDSLEVEMNGENLSHSFSNERSREEFRTIIKSELAGKAPDLKFEFNFFSSVEILEKMIEKISQDDMGKRKERYQSPLKEAIRHIAAAASTNPQLAVELGAKIEELGLELEDK